MRPKRITQDTVGNTVYPTNFRGGTFSIIATPSGAGNYTVQFTTTDIFDTSLTPSWEDVTDMATATTQQTKELGSITAIKVILHSGTSVTVDIVQSDV